MAALPPPPVPLQPVVFDVRATAERRDGQAYVKLVITHPVGLTALFVPVDTIEGIAAMLTDAARQAVGGLRVVTKGQLPR